MRIYNTIKDEIRALKESPILETDEGSRLKLQELELLSRKKFIEIERLQLCNLKRNSIRNGHDLIEESGAKAYISEFTK